MPALLADNMVAAQAPGQCVQVPQRRSWVTCVEIQR
jgi:hypothetical protein